MAMVPPEAFVRLHAHTHGAVSKHPRHHPRLQPPFVQNRSQAFFFLFNETALFRQHALLTGGFPGCVYHLTQRPRRFHLPPTRGEYFHRNRTRHEKIKRQLKKENPNARPKSEPDSPSDALRGIVLVDRPRPSSRAWCCMHTPCHAIERPKASRFHHECRLYHHEQQDNAASLLWFVALT